MSEDLKKQHLRTQGKYSDMGKMKSRDKRQKISPASKEPPGKRNHNRYSNESKGSNSAFSDDNVSPVKYEENSDYSFSQLEDSWKATEIVDYGKTVISSTNNGDSVIFYEPQFLEYEEGMEFFRRFYCTLDWHCKNIVVNGEEHLQPRMIAWFGPYPYSYSGSTLEPAEMPESVLEMKLKVEEYLKKSGVNATFNSVLLNLYRNGKDSVAWHSDDELSMGICPTIASVSLGETRKFEMRPKTKFSEGESPCRKQDRFFVHLTHGSLLVMDGSVQDDWQHRVPKEYHDREPRINLTFRSVFPLENTSTHKVPVKEVKKHPVDSWNSTPSSKVNFDDEDFPPLNSVSSASSGVGCSNHETASNSSLRPDDFNRSCDICDSETCFNEKSDVEKNVSNSEPTYDISFAVDDVKHAVKIKDENDSSFEMNSVENSADDSVESPSDVKECTNSKKVQNEWCDTLAKEFVPPSDVNVSIDNKKPQKKWLNVLAKEFVPTKASLRLDSYSCLPLEDLLYYEVELMHGEVLFNFSYNLKTKVERKLPEFARFVREELDFLCLLTDGTQTEKNQKLISARMINIVMNNLKRHQALPTVQKSFDRNPKPHSYGRQNHTDRGGRRYHQNQGRDNAHRC